MIIEFAGLPNSGKSTCLSTLKDYYARKGYSVKLLLEGARICPFPAKYRIRTAFWTANRVLNDIIQISTLNGKNKLFLQDRGLLDSIAFLKLLLLEGKVGKGQSNVSKFPISEPELMEYITHLSRWAVYVDLVVLFRVDYHQAIDRDLASKLSAGPGVITNFDTLKLLEKAYKFVLDNYADRFSKIKVIDTTIDNQFEVAENVRDIIDELWSSL